ncbi:MAG TPA: zinc ribbon domain-containing protein [Verrucomicrobium sp.]|nr:zinc ribbon domain-containing protein [Verrucomicrobium sp.]
MPVYDYTCRDCGDFVLFRTIEERNLAASCPCCQGAAERFISAPNLALMNPAKRKANFINERSRHEPRVNTAHKCGSSCGCETGPTTKIRPNRQQKTPLGVLQRQKKGSRPWMLGH